MNENTPEQLPAERFANQANKMMGDDDPEVDLWKGSFSPKSMTGAWILAAIVTVTLLAVILFTSLRNYQWVWWIALAAIAIYWLYLLCLLTYRKLSMHYELTSQRLKHREGIFVRALDRIELIDIDDVMYKQGPIQALLNVGNITIKSSDSSHPELIMYGIADIRTVADKIDDARRAERRKRGLHIEAV